VAGVRLPAGLELLAHGRQAGLQAPQLGDQGIEAMLPVVGRRGVAG
jgi:hypothetical protein